MRRLAALCAALLGAASLQACGEKRAHTAPEQPEPLLSGSTFLTPETQALHADAFANPGFLWVDQGRIAFQAAPENGPSCASCHGAQGESLAGVAARLPAWDAAAGKPLNLEHRINACREQRQGLAPLAYESQGLLSLTAYVASLSRGAPMKVRITPELQPAYVQGQAYFTTRRGQLNLACTQCHSETWGRQLRGDTISQGHGNGFPAYRFEWQSLGSLHRRFQDCDAGVRAEPLPLGSDGYVALELFLAARAASLPLESPAVRR